MNELQEVQSVVINLSHLIGQALRSLKAEETYPSPSADASDDKIKHLRERVVGLRRMREEFEDIMARVAGGL
jgi:hypothetical protein